MENQSSFGYKAKLSPSPVPENKNTTFVQFTA